MKRFFVPAVLATAAGLLVACNDQPQKPRPRPAPYPQPTHIVEEEPGDHPVRSHEETEPTQPVDHSPAVEATPNVRSGNPEYGKKVPGKDGFVTSPYSSAGYVDVRGFPPGTEVKDPYTGKIFLVP